MLFPTASDCIIGIAACGKVMQEGLLSFFWLRIVEAVPAADPALGVKTAATRTVVALCAVDTAGVHPPWRRGQPRATALPA